MELNNREGSSCSVSVGKDRWTIMIANNGSTIKFRLRILRGRYGKPEQNYLLNQYNIMRHASSYVCKMSLSNKNRGAERRDAFVC